jgi:hypothetical protein
MTGVGARTAVALLLTLGDGSTFATAGHRVCCIVRDRAACWCGGAAGQMACASSVNALATRSFGATSMASS